MRVSERFQKSQIQNRTVKPVIEADPGLQRIVSFPILAVSADPGEFTFRCGPTLDFLLPFCSRRSSRGLPPPRESPNPITWF